MLYLSFNIAPFPTYKIKKLTSKYLAFALINKTQAVVQRLDVQSKVELFGCCTCHHEFYILQLQYATDRLNV